MHGVRCVVRGNPVFGATAPPLNALQGCAVNYSRTDADIQQTPEQDNMHESPATLNDPSIVIAIASQK